MGYGLILQVASIVLVVLFVVLTEARPATKGAAVLGLVSCLAVPRFLPEASAVCLGLKAALSIAIIIYLKLQGVVH